MDYKIVVGLGKTEQVDSMVIQWPDLSYSKYIHPDVNRLYRLNEREEKKYSVPPLKGPAQANTMLAEVKNIFEKHTEDDYVDFFYERNIPRMLSGKAQRQLWQM
jgi:hypothetical protein